MECDLFFLKTKSAMYLEKFYLKTRKFILIEHISCNRKFETHIYNNNVCIKLSMFWRLGNELNLFVTENIIFFYFSVNPIHVQNLISLAALTGGNSISPSGKFISAL